MKTLTIGFVLLSLAIHAQSVPPKKSVSDTARSSTATKESSPAVGDAKAKSEVKVSEEEGVNEGPAAKNEKREAAVTSIEPEALAGFEHYAPQLQQLIRDALALTKLNLTYTFGVESQARGHGLLGDDLVSAEWRRLEGCAASVERDGRLGAVEHAAAPHAHGGLVEAPGVQRLATRRLAVLDRHVWRPRHVRSP